VKRVKSTSQIESDSFVLKKNLFEKPKTIKKARYSSCFGRFNADFFIFLKNFMSHPFLTQFSYRLIFFLVPPILSSTSRFPSIKYRPPPNDRRSIFELTTTPIFLMRKYTQIGFLK